MMEVMLVTMAMARDERTRTLWMKPMINVRGMHRGMSASVTPVYPFLLKTSDAFFFTVF